MKQVQLNLGCGYKHKKGFVNIDLLKECNPDIILDLDKEALPFKNNSVDYIHSEFLFEHLNNFGFVLRECHRVLKSDGLMFMLLPYATSISGDYEYHMIRPRYSVFADFDKDSLDRMVTSNPLFKIRRKIIFPWWCGFMNIINKNTKLINVYERTGIRYMLPAIELELKMSKEKRFFGDKK